jgi:hypothetical protein
MTKPKEFIQGYNHYNGLHIRRFENPYPEEFFPEKHKLWAAGYQLAYSQKLESVKLKEKIASEARNF